MRSLPLCTASSLSPRPLRLPAAAVNNFLKINHATPSLKLLQRRTITSKIKFKFSNLIHAANGDTQNS